jgi:glycosyltransferase involved in cell wall biosynthesis
VRADLIDYLGISESRVGVLHQAADAEVFFPRRDNEALAALRRKYPALPADGRYFFSLSSFTPRKNIAALIEAFAAALQGGADDGDLYLVLGGYLTERQQASILGLAPNAAVRERVRIVGGVDDADFAPLLSPTLGFVFLSLAEGFGLPPLEAMMCAAPVICSNATSLPEVVGDAALCVEPDDVDAAAAAMCRLANDETLRSDLSARGVERAAQFSWDRCAEDVKAAYLATLSG